MSERTPLLVLGLGNVLLEDDGLGRRGGGAARRSLRRRPTGVGVLDGGTLGLSLLPYLEDADARDPRRRHQGRCAARHASSGSTATTWRRPSRRACRRIRSAWPTCSTARAGSTAIRRARPARPRAGIDGAGCRPVAAVRPALPALVERVVDEARALGFVFRRRSAHETPAAWCAVSMSLVLPACAEPMPGLPPEYRRLDGPRERLGSADARSARAPLFLSRVTARSATVSAATVRRPRREGLSPSPRDFTSAPGVSSTSAAPRLLRHPRRAWRAAAMPSWKALSEQARRGTSTAFVLVARRTARDARPAADRDSWHRPGRRLPALGLSPRDGGGPHWPRAQRRGRRHDRGVRIGEALDAFVRRWRRRRPPAACIRELRAAHDSPGASSATSASSERGAGRARVSIPPDLATCADCLSEIFDPANRRYRYPFTNCTNCGPRFTIARDVPYDRPATTMAAFRDVPGLPARVRRPSDRRFHAQPNACPACGPACWC